MNKECNRKENEPCGNEDRLNDMDQAFDWYKREIIFVLKKMAGKQNANKYDIIQTPAKLGMSFWHAVDKNTGEPLKDKKGFAVVSSNKELVEAYVMGVQGIGLA